MGENGLKKISAVILGCGNRGQAYADYSIYTPEELEIVAVIDINAHALENAMAKYHVSPQNAFKSLDEFLKAKISCDIVINATMDKVHYETSVALLKAGYNLLLEKPVTANPGELLEIDRLSKENGCKVVVCHVLRYTPYFKAIKKLINSGKIGKIINIQANEHVWVSHFIESYVRGPWKSEKECGSGFLLAKSCHDLDMICWLNNTTVPKAVSSFGERALFVKENMPEGATEYCYNCPHEKNCLYSAIKLHLEFAPMAFQTYGALINELGKELSELTYEDKLEYLKHSDYGKCAYIGNDLVDRQVVSISFENGSMATFNMIGASARPDRYIHIIGTQGEIEGKISENAFVVRSIDRSEGNYRWVEETVDVSKLVIDNKYQSHAGGDYGIMYDLVRYLNGTGDMLSLTTIEDSIYGHFCVYEAEKSRKIGQVIDFKEFMQKERKE